MKISQTVIAFIALAMFATPALAENTTKKQCDLIIKDGFPQQAVELCIAKYYPEPSSIFASDPGSSTSYEPDRAVSIIRGEDGKVYSLTPLDSSVTLPEGVKNLEITTIPEQNKMRVQRLERAATGLQQMERSAGN